MKRVFNKFMEEKQIINPHAMFFEKVFSRLDVATDFLKNYLSQEIVDKLDLSTIQHEKKSFISNELKPTQSDLLFKIKTVDGKSLFLYILLEHKSYVDRWAMLQLLGYIVEICEEQRAINKYERKKTREENLKNNRPENEGIETEYLNPVIPVIIYHGKTQWNEKINLSSLFYDAKMYKNYLPNFQYELINIANYADNEFKGYIILKVALMAMKHYFMDDFEEKVPEMLNLLFDLVYHRNSETGFLMVLLRYIGTNKNYDKDWLKANLVKVYKEKGEKIMNSFVDIWINEGKEEGIKEGKKEGIIEVIIDTLNIRFRNVSQSIINLLHEIQDNNTLRTLHREAVITNNLNEFQTRLNVHYQKP